MNSFGEIIRNLREEKQLPLRIISAYLEIDQAILSKIERGQRKINRDQVIRLAEYFKINKNDLLVAWLSDRLVYDVIEEELALKALQVAEEKVEYLKFKKMDRKELIQKINTILSHFKQIQKAWIYGSFARNDDGPKSDIDIALEADSTFSYFDLADLEYKLENSIHRKEDIGFIDAFNPYIFENIKLDLMLVYEK